MDTISKNSIMFIGLANEYCNLVENSEDFEKEQFVEQMLKILPRIYIYRLLI